MAEKQAATRKAGQQHKRKTSPQVLKELGEQVNKQVEIYKTSPEDLLELTKFMGTLHEYSTRNKILIQKQFPHAQAVAPLSEWNKRGFRIHKGEHAITIRVPKPYKVFTDANGKEKRIKYATAEERKAIKEGQLRTSTKINYTYGKVFELSQTTATPEDLPKIYPNRVFDFKVSSELDEKGMWKGLNRLADALGTSIRIEETRDEIGNARGVYMENIVTGESAIVLNKGNSPTQNIAVAMHELAHCQMHGGDKKGRNYTTPEKEFQAELTAYMTAYNYGIDTAEKTIPYLAGWTNNNKDIENDRLIELMEEVQGTAGFFIDTLDREIKSERQPAREIEAETTETAVTQGEEVLTTEPETAPAEEAPVNAREEAETVTVETVQPATEQEPEAEDTGDLNALLEKQFGSAWQEMTEEQNREENSPVPEETVTADEVTDTPMTAEASEGHAADEETQAETEPAPAYETAVTEKADEPETSKADDAMAETGTTEEVQPEKVTEDAVQPAETQAEVKPAMTEIDTFDNDITDKILNDAYKVCSKSGEQAVRNPENWGKVIGKWSQITSIRNRFDTDEHFENFYKANEETIDALAHRLEEESGQKMPELEEPIQQHNLKAVGAYRYVCGKLESEMQNGTFDYGRAISRGEKHAQVMHETYSQPADDKPAGKAPDKQEEKQEPKLKSYASIIEGTKFLTELPPKKTAVKPKLQQHSMEMA